MEGTMEKIFIEQIRENDKVNSIFLVKDKILATGKTGKQYLTLRLGDRTGEIDARIWDNAEQISLTFKKGDFVQIKSRTQLYQGNIQLIINSLESIKEEDVLIDEFLPKTGKNIEKMFLELREMAGKIEEKHLRALLDLFFDDRKFVSLFKIAPAAKSIHHVVIGGLLEHTLSVCQLILLVRNHYDGIDGDLLLTAGILHDIGKIHELAYEKAFDYTDKGRLIGHVVMGAEMIQEKINQIEGFPEKLNMLLKHLLLSHHGVLEFGSPKRPKTLDALLLHYLDDMDAKMNAFSNFMETQGDPESGWTPYHRVFDRFLYSNRPLPKTQEDEMKNEE